MATLSNFDAMAPFGDDPLIALLMFSAVCFAALIGVITWPFGPAGPDPYVRPFGEMPTIDRRSPERDGLS